MTLTFLIPGVADNSKHPKVGSEVSPTLFFLSDTVSISLMCTKKPLSCGSTCRIDHVQFCNSYKLPWLQLIKKLTSSLQYHKDLEIFQQRSLLKNFTNSVQTKKYIQTEFDFKLC